jgi:hypothetical protein
VLLSSKVKIHEVSLAFDDKTSTLNPLEVINPDVTYSGFDLRDTQLGDLMVPFFLFNLEARSFIEFHRFLQYYETECRHTSVQSH